VNYTEEQVAAMNAEQIRSKTKGILDELTKQMACAPSPHLEPRHVNTFRSINEALRTPTALEMLKILDECAYGSEASDFCMRVMNRMLLLSIDLEGTTYDKVVESATWRKEPPYA